MLERIIKAARRQLKCDLVLKGGLYVDVFSGVLRRGDVGIVDGVIVGTGEYEGERQIDCTGKVIAPAYIDAHVHIESSQLSPEEFCALVTPRGTAAVVADPHEIANVCGVAGCEYIANCSKNLPLDIYLNFPSCVPATPFETSGAILKSKDVKENIGRDIFFGLGEFMNYPAVLAGDREAMDKIAAAHAAGKIVDGHAPSLTGYDLNGYIAAGIFTDHECMTADEALEKVSKGEYVLLRHGSTAKNLRVARAMNDKNFRRFAICTDDRHAADLMREGHIDAALRELVKMGIDPVRAITCATLNAAECYNLKRRGAIAPAYVADIVVLNDLKDFEAAYVIKGGEVAAKDGKLLKIPKRQPLPECVKNTVKFEKVCADSFKISLKSKRVNAIKMIPAQAATDREIVEVGVEGGKAILKEGILKLAVVERHGRTGNIAKGFLKGYGLKGGALGLTVAHDSHNLIVVGDDDESMAEVCNELRKIGGGLAIARRGEGAKAVALDIAGLMSSEPAEKFVEESEKLVAIAREMGVSGDIDPFLGLAFLSLGVIPKLKLLDTGLFDVEKFDFIDLEADDR